MTQQQRNLLAIHKGIVASKSGDKTVRVTLEYQTRHPKYGKLLRRRTRAHVHDETNLAQIGDTVEICKCRPMSKTKTWRLLKVIKTQ